LAIETFVSTGAEYVIEDRDGWTLKTPDKSFVASDLDEVIKLWSRIEELSFPVTFDTEERLTKFLLRNTGLSTIIKSNEKIVGALLCGHDGRRGFFYHTGVDNAYRKQGLATKMIERSFKMLRKEGIDNCFLFTNDFNKDAQKFWKARGFEFAPHVMYHSRSI
jgi:N-acetylglutamate synthase